MVSALDSVSSVPGSSPGRGTALCFWTRHFSLTVPLFAQVYKWVLANLLLGVTLLQTSIPSRGSRNTPSCFMLQKPGQLRMDHQAQMQNLRFTSQILQFPQPSGFYSNFPTFKPLGLRSIAQAHIQYIKNIQTWH